MLYGLNQFHTSQQISMIFKGGKLGFNWSKMNEDKVSNISALN